MSQGIILYGPPASGKNTITRQLGQIDSAAYILYRRIKVGGTPKADYRTRTEAELAELSFAGLVIWVNEAYGAKYVVEQTSLGRLLRRATPVLHLGQPEAVDAVVKATHGTRWVVVDLYCARSTAQARLFKRDPHEVDKRLAVWDLTRQLEGADISLDTGAHPANVCAEKIHRLVTERPTHCGQR